ncbi:MAG: LysR family transcriptional regulator [Pseudomonadota bacterium]
MPLRFTFRQLEYLVAVGEAGTIALAAQRLNVSSPSISAAISQLEAEFGIQLFVRHHAQGLALTPGGRRVHNEAKRILADAAGLNDLANDISDRVRGPISIGALSTLAPLVSAQARRSFERAYPEAQVTLREGNQVDLLRMLGTAEIDVAITYDLEIPNDIAFAELIVLPPCIMLPPDHPMAESSAVSLGELETEPMILYDVPLSREYFLSLFTELGLRPTIAERTTDIAVARSLVANGFGFSLVNTGTKTLKAPDGEVLAIRPVAEPLRPVVLGLATKQANHPSRIVTAFCAHMTDWLQANGLPETVALN